MRSNPGMANRQGGRRLALRASLRPQLPLWLGLAWLRFIHSTSASSRRHIYKNHSSRHEERLNNSHIKKGQSVPNTSRRTASSVLEGVIWSVTTKRSRIVGDSPCGSNVVWLATSRHRTSARWLPGCQLTSILHGPDEWPTHIPGTVCLVHRSYVLGIMDQSKDRQVNDNPRQRDYSCCHLSIGVSWNVGEQRL